MLADQVAIRILLSDAPKAKKTAMLAAVARAASDLVHNRATCPGCGNEGPHEDNGLSPSHPDFSMLCTACGTSFER